MTNSQNRIDADGEITSEACAWVAQMESGDLSASDIAALREWMARSPAHSQEIRQIVSLNAELGVLNDLANPLREVTAQNNRLRKRSLGLSISGSKLFAACASFLAVAFFAAYLFMDTLFTPVEIYRTAVGQYQTIVLSDGTEVKLNTNSQIEVDYSSKTRRVRLIHGEALFDVARNPLRPFVVYSDQAKAEALGTSFVVRLRDAFTEVAVIEGVVAVSKLATSFPVPQVAGSASLDEVPEQRADVVQPVLINAGQFITSGDIPTDMSANMVIDIPTLSNRELQRKLSWTEGLFDFSGTRLEEVVHEVSRHNDVIIEIADPALKDIEFGGMFRTGDVDSLLEALEGLDIDVQRNSLGIITLQKSNSI